MITPDPVSLRTPKFYIKENAVFTINKNQIFDWWYV